MKKLLICFALAAFLTGSAFAAGPTLTAPNDGTALCLGSHYNIAWTYTGSTHIRLVLRQNGTVAGTIALDLPATQHSYDWTVGKLANGTSVSPGTGFIVRVKTIDDANHDDSDNPFEIKNCPRPDLGKYRFSEKIICKWPGPGCPGCPPDFDLSKLRERIGDPSENLRLVLLKNGRQIQELGLFGKGRGLPNSVKGKLSEADSLLLKNGQAKFALGLLGADGKLRGTYPVEVQ
jgi:hypothetical protein